MRNDLYAQDVGARPSERGARVGMVTLHPAIFPRACPMPDSTCSGLYMKLKIHVHRVEARPVQSRPVGSLASTNALCTVLAAFGVTHF